MSGRLDLWVRDGQVGFAGPQPLPLDRLLLGRPVVEVLEIMPRLFNLCATAQTAALRLALAVPDAGADLTAEVLRDHLALLTQRWPRALGLAPLPLPPGWARDRRLARRVLLGPADLPCDAEGFGRWLARGQGVAPVLAAIDAAFGPGEATARLPLVTPETALAGEAAENSPAARRAGHPLLAAIAARRGRGPLWHAAGRLADAVACVEGRFPGPQSLGPGRAVAPAARGLCAVAARAEAGTLVAFARRTPTDHLLAEGGGLSQALGNLTPPAPERVRLLVEILDPCLPHVLHEATDA